ncbi:MAG: hypothetical protein IJ187_00455 [Neisseriaceae bacterium]|nr:hypothetical protein [Neisseriaceae bacterium]
MNNQNNDELLNAMLKMEMLRVEILRQRQLDMLDKESIFNFSLYDENDSSILAACKVSFFYTAIIISVCFFFPQSMLSKIVSAVLGLICIVHCCYLVLTIPSR